MKYQNPIKKKGDYADPFVLKYNGRYYLYCTNPDIRCWSSDDLLHWKLEGATIGENVFPDMVPFAPEVVYWNGYFYMYTSPSGFGHYILQSKSPTGPFIKISENVEHAIDGTIFIDDDGTWYFYWAGDEGIWGCKMKSPTEFGEPVLTGAFLNGWTEGPLVYKKDGIYYMTYTGNHYLSKGYRINSCWSRNPLSGYRDDSYNPVVVRAAGKLIGLGHSSTVEGPDIVSDYIVYHNMNEDTTRDLNIDRQLWYQEVTQIAGPTQIEQLAPELADYALLGQGKALLELICYRGTFVQKSDRLASAEDGMFALSAQAFDKSFTLECNLEIKTLRVDDKQGIVLAKEEDDYYCIAFNPDLQIVQFIHQCKGVEQVVVQSRLPEHYNFSALHCIKICRNMDGRLELYIDRRLQFTSEVEKCAAYRVGYIAESNGLEIGYTAVTESTNQEQAECTVFPMECAFYPVFGKITGERNPDGSILLEQGETAQYSVWAGVEDTYRCWISTNCQSSGETEVLIDNKKLGVCESCAGLTLFETKLNQGIHVLSLWSKTGVKQINRIKFYPSADRIDYENELSGVELHGYGKRLTGNTWWSDYAVSATLSVKCEAEGNAGILLRVTEPSEGGEGADPVLGANFFIGYSVSLTGTELVIMKHHYDEKVLKSCPFCVESDEIHELLVEISGITIEVYVDREKQPKLVVADAEPIENGCAGIRVKNGWMKVTDFSLKEGVS
ncbi:glycoside hydrolase family 43 protein [Parablautia intestinalis]|uniref:glycoside hydrolase family 43 protein n=1 Tax=Parablautia intestinalis TaxID=2320100 RepID=UPI00256F4194|nr:glycoside hydrolase family 43 protein [Parablautia intestinalis]